MKTNGSSITVVHEFPDSQKVNEELRRLARKSRPPQTPRDDGSHSASDKHVVSMSKVNIKVPNSDDVHSVKSRPVALKHQLSRTSNFSARNGSLTLRARNIRLLKHLKVKQAEKEKRNLQYFEKCLKDDPMLCAYKREHIRKFGKPIFILNTKSYLQRREFAVLRSRALFD